MNKNILVEGLMIPIVAGAFWVSSIGAAPRAVQDLSDPSVEGYSVEGYSVEGYSVEVEVIDVEPIVTRTQVTESQRVCSRPAYSNRDYSYHTQRPPRTEWAYEDGHEADYGYERHEPSRRRGGVGRTILGTLIGSVVGNQFGGGGGKRALTIVGALVGASIANRPPRRPTRHERGVYESDYATGHDSSPRYHCSVTPQTRVVDRIDGFDVTYSYNGELLTKRMDIDPGERMDIWVRITPQLSGEIL